ncbi:hypothetical protein JOQ06_028468 [Pogonophryne albipinna]|uniref:C2H2-type domain-containing protein n=1 Tax=Pogonophryne albipinna TaxID=1090488 RepID=A0AAD6B6J8_9TELE|nr:hypothetical protein JOQ06_028468 [Pogonophryne albipinna]
MAEGETEKEYDTRKAIEELRERFQGLTTALKESLQSPLEASLHFCQEFCQVLVEHVGRWKTDEDPLPLLEVYTLAILSFAQASSCLSSECENVPLLLEKLALSCAELLLLLPQHVPGALWEEFQSSMKLAHSLLLETGSTQLCLLSVLAQQDGVWSNTTLSSIMSNKTPQTEQVNEYLEFEGAALLNMRIKHLIKVESVDKAAVLAKMCSEYPGYEGKGNFKQTYLLCICMKKSQEQLMEEIASIDCKDALEMICNLESEGDEKGALCLCSAFLKRQLLQGDVYCAWELTLFWSKLLMRLESSADAFLGHSKEMALLCRSVCHILFLIKVIQNEVGEVGLPVCVEMCIQALKMTSSDHKDSKSTICKTISCLLPTDLEVKRACQLTEFLLQPTVDSYYAVESLYNEPDQKPEEDGSLPVPNSLRCELLLAFKTQWPFDPEFWDWKTLKRNCLALMGDEAAIVSSIDTLNDTDEQEVDNALGKLPEYRDLEDFLLTTTNELNEITDEREKNREAKKLREQGFVSARFRNWRAYMQYCVLCDKEFLGHRIVRHAQKHFKDGVYLCPICADSFETREILEPHVASHVKQSCKERLAAMKAARKVPQSPKSPSKHSKVATKAFKFFRNLMAHVRSHKDDDEAMRFLEIQKQKVVCHSPDLGKEPVPVRVKHSIESMLNSAGYPEMQEADTCYTPLTNPTPATVDVEPAPELPHVHRDMGAGRRYPSNTPSVSASNEENLHSCPHSECTRAYSTNKSLSRHVKKQHPDIFEDWKLAKKYNKVAKITAKKGNRPSSQPGILCNKPGMQQMDYPMGSSTSPAQCYSGSMEPVPITPMYVSSSLMLDNGGQIHNSGHQYGLMHPEGRGDSVDVGKSNANVTYEADSPGADCEALLSGEKAGDPDVQKGKRGRLSKRTKWPAIIKDGKVICRRCFREFTSTKSLGDNEDNPQAPQNTLPGDAGKQDFIPDVSIVAQLPPPQNDMTDMSLCQVAPSVHEKAPEQPEVAVLNKSPDVKQKCHLQEKLSPVSKGKKQHGRSDASSSKLKEPLSSPSIASASSSPEKPGSSKSTPTKDEHQRKEKHQKRLSLKMCDADNPFSPYRPYRCVHEGCTAAFTIQQNLILHYRAMHQASLPPSKPEPDIEMENVENGQESHHSIDKDDEVRCQVKNCSRVFLGITRLVQHYLLLHKFTRDKATTMMASMNIGTFNCDRSDCALPFNSVEKYIEHIKNYHKEIAISESGSVDQTFKCEFVECDRVYSTKSNLLRHLIKKHAYVYDPKTSDGRRTKAMGLFPGLNGKENVENKFKVKKKNTKKKDGKSIEHWTSFGKPTLKSHDEASAMCTKKSALQYPCMIIGCDAVERAERSIFKHYTTHGLTERYIEDHRSQFIFCKKYSRSRFKDSSKSEGASTSSSEEAEPDDGEKPSDQKTDELVDQVGQEDSKLSNDDSAESQASTGTDGGMKRGRPKKPAHPTPACPERMQTLRNRLTVNSSRENSNPGTPTAQEQRDDGAMPGSFKPLGLEDSFLKFLETSESTHSSKRKLNDKSNAELPSKRQLTHRQKSAMKGKIEFRGCENFGKTFKQLR